LATHTMLAGLFDHITSIDAPEGKEEQQAQRL
jgi:hypothetical protein